MESRNSNISYRGLTRQLSKNIYTHDAIGKLSELYPQSNGIVGNLPSQWIKNIPAENKSDKIKSLYSNLGMFFAHVFPITRSSTISNKILTSILRKGGAIAKDSEVSIRYEAQGFVARGYKIENVKENYSLFLKKYKKVSSYMSRRLRHGVNTESNTKVFLDKNIKQKSDKKHFSKFCYGDIKHNYYIEEFIEDINDKVSDKRDYMPPIFKVLSKLGLKISDLHSGNLKIKKDKDGKYYGVAFDLGQVFRKPKSQS